MALNVSSTLSVCNKNKMPKFDSDEKLRGVYTTHTIYKPVYSDLALYSEYNFWAKKNFIFFENKTSLTKTRQQKQIGSLIEIRLTEGVKQHRYNFPFSHDHLLFFL